jgi:hypothetical protein
MGCGCGGRGNNSVRRTTAVQPGSTGLIRASTRQIQTQGIQAQAQKASNRRAAMPQPNNQEVSGMSQERREIEKRRRIQVSLRNRSRKINNPPN